MGACAPGWPAGPGRNNRVCQGLFDQTPVGKEPKTPAETPGRLDRALGDALGILLAELVIAAYALIVASPFIVLGIAAFFGNRAYRRHADQRLLERA